MIFIRYSLHACRNGRYYPFFFSNAREIFFDFFFSPFAQRIRHIRFISANSEGPLRVTAELIDSETAGYSVYLSRLTNGLEKNKLCAYGEQILRLPNMHTTT